MYKKWLERIQNLLDVQKEMQLEEIHTRFTRRDLIELRVMINTLIALDELETEEALFKAIKACGGKGGKNV